MKYLGQNLNICNTERRQFDNGTKPQAQGDDADIKIQYFKFSEDSFCRTNISFSPFLFHLSFNLKSSKKKRFKGKSKLMFMKAALQCHYFLQLISIQDVSVSKAHARNKSQKIQHLKWVLDQIHKPCFQILFVTEVSFHSTSYFSNKKKSY